MIGKTILIVDENEASRGYLLSILKERQFTVLQAGSGREALISAWRDHPDLVLFDPTFSDIKDIEFIQKLRQNARSDQMHIVAFSSDPAPTRREACLKAGVDEYIIKSSDAVPQLHEVLDRIFGAGTIPSKVSEPGQALEKEGLLMVFLSAKGGTGTSSLCANFAMIIKDQNPDARVVVVDLVLPIGSIAQIVGYEGEQNLVTVADLPSEETNQEYFLENLPAPASWKFQLLAGSPDPEHGNKLKGGRIGEIVDVLRASYDFIIIDLGRSLSRISLPLIQQADLIPLILSTDQSTVKLTKTIWEYLHAQGVDSQNIYAILNRAVGLEGLTKSEAEQIIGFPIKTTFPYMGGNFALANNLNHPIITKYPKDTASIIFKDAAGEMVKLARQLRARSLLN